MPMPMPSNAFVEVELHTTLLHFYSSTAQRNANARTAPEFRTESELQCRARSVIETNELFLRLFLRRNDVRTPYAQHCTTLLACNTIAHGTCNGGYGIENAIMVRCTYVPHTWCSECLRNRVGELFLQSDRILLPKSVSSTIIPVASFRHRFATRRRCSFTFRVHKMQHCSMRSIRRGLL